MQDPGFLGPRKMKGNRILHWQGRVIRGSKLIFLDCFAF